MPPEYDPDTLEDHMEMLPMSTEELIAQAYEAFLVHEGKGMSPKCPEGVRLVMHMVDHLVRQRTLEHVAREGHKETRAPRKDRKDAKQRELRLVGGK